MRTDILQQAQAIRESMDAATGGTVMASLSASAFNSLAVSLNRFSKSNIFDLSKILFTRI